MTTRTLGIVYTALLLIVGAVMTLLGSLTSGSVGAVALIAFGAAGVAAGLVLLGLRLAPLAR